MSSEDDDLLIQYNSLSAALGYESPVPPGLRQTPSPSIQQGGRPAGPGSRGSVLPPADAVNKHELEAMFAHVERLDLPTVVVWRSKRLFTYAAVCTGRSTERRWFITGKGDWYGGNEFDHDVFINQVLLHPEVTLIVVLSKVKFVYERAR